MLISRTRRGGEPLATDPLAAVPQTEVEAGLERIFFRPVHWQGAFDVTVQRLAQAIKLGALKAGARLPPERELVRRLGVSRTTLREAARALQQEGYLRTSRGRSGGTFVRAEKVPAVGRDEARRLALGMGQDFFDLMDVRSAVEPKAAELAAERADAPTIARFQRLIHSSQSAPISERRRADSTLHITIAHASESRLLLDLVLDEQMRLHELLAFLSTDPTPKAFERHSSLVHGEIVGAIADGDPLRARAAMEDHINATNELLRKILEP